MWIIDPLDGTREFTMAGRAGLGRARGPVGGRRRHHRRRGGAAGDGRGVRHRPRRRPARRPSPVAAGRCILVSDSRPPAFAAAVAAGVGADVAPMGSAGAKTMAVVRGDADAYVHAGGQWEWDSAAPVGVALAAGLARVPARRRPVACTTSPTPTCPTC